MAKDKEKYIFYFNKLHKRWRKGQAPPAITYFAFGKNNALSAVETLNEYINRSKPWRESYHEKELLLSSIRSFFMILLQKLKIGSREYGNTFHIEWN